MRINDEQARTFYMEECAKAAWSVRQLERQVNTMYYQRILASQDKTAVAKEIQKTEPKPEYEKNSERSEGRCKSSVVQEEISDMAERFCCNAEPLLSYLGFKRKRNEFESSYFIHISSIDFCVLKH